MLVIFCLLIALCGVTAVEVHGSNRWLLPRLFEVDNYEECLSQADGVYCLGSFHLIPAETPNPIYDLMTSYPKDGFNRTLIHRGYCVSTCSSTSAGDVVERFKNCAEDWARQHRFHANLHELKYCRKHQDVKATRYIGWPEIAFLIVIALIILLNAASTIYDYVMRNKEKKITLITAWSLHANWKLLTGIDSRSRSSSLRPVQGMRVIIAFSACVSHCAFSYYSMFLYTPETFEDVLMGPFLILLMNSMSVVQLLIILSCYMCTLSILKASEKNYSIGTLFKVIARRIFRLGPVYLLVIAFASTWWPWLGDGPFWPTHVTAQGDICREKFWTHVFFINNIINPDKLCILPTWYVAVDVQMYIFTAVITMALIKMSKKALPILTMLLIGSIFLNAALAYKFDWTAIMFMKDITEHIHNLGRNFPSLTRFYMSLWGNLSACFVGLIVGHLWYYKAGKRKESHKEINPKKNKKLLQLIYVVSVPGLAGSMMLGNYYRHIQNPIFLAIYASVEKTIFQIMILLVFYIFSIVNSSIFKIFAWRGWEPMARVSLSVMMIHWCIALIIISPSPQPLISSSFYSFTLCLGITCISYVLAVPFTLMVQFPMSKTFEIIFG